MTRSEHQLVSIEVDVDVSRFQTGRYFLGVREPGLTWTEYRVRIPSEIEKISWIVQHAGICLGAGPLSEVLVNHFRVWSENTRTGELRVTVADRVRCGAQTGSRCSAKVRRLQRFE